MGEKRKYNSDKEGKQGEKDEQCFAPKTHIVVSAHPLWPVWLNPCIKSYILHLACIH